MNYKNFIYMEEQGFIFAYVPKVACSNWKALLRYMAGKEDWLNTRLAHDKINGGLRYLDFSNPQDLNLLTQPGIRKYAMVRNPYSRTLSAYLNKIENRLPLKPESENEDHFCKVVRAIDQFRQDKLDTVQYPEITFEVFLLWLKDGSSWFTKDEHWAPQTTLLRHPQVSFDILGRFETLVEDAPRILTEMGCDQGFPTQKDVKFAPTKAQEKLGRYYTPVTCQIVEKTFNSDLMIFGYPRMKTSQTPNPAVSIKDTYLYCNDNQFTTVRDPYDSDEFVAKTYAPLSDAFSAAEKYEAFFADKPVLPTLIELLNREKASAAPLKVMDCGVYMGMFSIAAGLIAAQKRAPVSVSAYEANPTLVTPIKKNFQLYGVEVELHNYGVSGEEGTLEFVHAANRMIGGTLFNPNAKKNGDFYTTQCRVIGLDKVLPDEPTPGLVKLDIEGSEVDAFNSIWDSSSKCNNVFIVEFSEWQASKKIASVIYENWIFEHFDVFYMGSWVHCAAPREVADYADLVNQMNSGRRLHNADLLLIPKGLQHITDAIRSLP